MDNAFIILIVIAVVTFLIRALPFLLFKNRELPVIIKYLGDTLPPAIMVTLVVYCLKSVNVLTGSHGIPEFISVILVAVMHLWKKNTLLSIAAGTVVYMLLVQFVF